MTDDTERAQLLARYEAAVERLDAATAVIVRQMEKGTRPSPYDLREEQDARDEVVRLRRAIWRGWPSA